MSIVLLHKSSDQNVTAKKQQGACPKRSRDLWGIPREIRLRRKHHETTLPRLEMEYTV